MKRTVLFLLVGICLIALDVAFARIRPPPIRPEIKAEAPEVKVVVPEAPHVVEMTLPPLIITTPRRTRLTAAVPPLPAPDVGELRCGAWRPLASDESQTVRYCESR